MTEYGFQYDGKVVIVQLVQSSSDTWLWQLRIDGQALPPTRQSPRQSREDAMQFGIDEARAIINKGLVPPLPNDQL